MATIPEKSARLVRLLTVLALAGCATGSGTPPEEMPPVHPPRPLLNLEVAAVPETTGLPTTLSELKDPANRYAFDHFAWQTFVALNWPAVVPDQNKNGSLRGFPDLSDPDNVNFVNAGRFPALVWETFIEKREMFDHDAKTAEDARPRPWNSPLSKRIYGNGKFATLDETVEVRAEALEGYSGANAKFAGLPAVARVFRGTQAGPDTAVRYEVKMDYDFYKYVVDHGLYFDPAADARSRKVPPVQLPWRTSLPEPGVTFHTQKPADVPYAQGYLVASTLEAYRKGAAKAKEEAGRGLPVDVVPPRLGAIHIKAAWAPIAESEKEKFITRCAEYFISGPPTRPPCAGSASPGNTTGLFGLVGLHIIQRIKVEAPANQLNGQAIGGTFLYSTWEHTDIRETQGGPGTQYTYTNYFQDGSGFKPVPSLDDPLYVYRLYPILDHTREFNQAVWNQVGPGSVWSNYRLVGTQFLPVDIGNDGKIALNYPTATEVPAPDPATNPNDLGGIGQPVYLSNLVVETNLGLQQFQGQPPGVTPAPQFGPAAQGPGAITFNPTAGTFYRTQADVPAPQNPNNFGNLRFGNSRQVTSTVSSYAYNMGGCMGCHGVAQLNGFSFSFVLLGGQAGADPDTEKSFEPPGTSVAQKNIPLLVAGDTTSLKAFNGKYLANGGGAAMLQDSPVNLTLLAADGRALGSPFRFGDGVTIADAAGNYLTAQPPASATGPSPVVFVAKTAAIPAAAVWYLYDPADPTSTGDVLRLGNLSFRNAAVTYLADPAPPRLPLPAVLSAFYPGKPNGVSTVNHDDTDEAWTAGN